jgi:hypothetical protein
MPLVDSSYNFVGQHTSRKALVCRLAAHNVQLLKRVSCPANASPPVNRMIWKYFEEVVIMLHGWSLPAGGPYAHLTHRETEGTTFDVSDTDGVSWSFLIIKRPRCVLMAARRCGSTREAEWIVHEYRLRKTSSLNALPTPASCVGRRNVPLRRLAKGSNRRRIFRICHSLAA